MTEQLPLPPMQPSDEATQEQLDLAREQGNALQRALNAMTHMGEHSKPRLAGDYEIICVVEDAEGLYMPRDGRLVWQEPESENAHLEVCVRDAADGRFIPGLRVHATISDTNDNQVQSLELPFLWHPWLYHYGANIRVPGSGTYSIRVRVAAPDFPRHDKTNGHRYAEPVDITFHGVLIKTGKKQS